MKPFPATAPQEKSHVRNWRSKGPLAPWMRPTKFPEIELPNPPEPYVRRENKKLGTTEIAIRTEDKDGNPYYVPVSPNDIYPVRILRNTQNGEVQERTQWAFHLARMGRVTMEVKQSVLSDTKQLHSLLMNVGVYATSSEVKTIQDYMSAYLKKLASEFDRERVISRLGWQDDHNGFVAGNRMVHMDGSVVPCNLTQSVRNTVKNGLATKGSQEQWTRLVNEYYVGDM